MTLAFLSEHSMDPRIERRCYVALQRPDGSEQIILVDTYCSERVQMVRDTLWDAGIPLRVGYSDRETGIILFDTFDLAKEN